MIYSSKYDDRVSHLRHPIFISRIYVIILETAQYLFSICDYINRKTVTKGGNARGRQTHH